jgi:hypothetical protein
MLKRFSSAFAFILLFAFVQMGAITHEISHYNESAQHRQQDKNTHNQCAQCISYAEVAGGLPAHGVTFLRDDVSFSFADTHHNSVQSPLLTHYAARAPPQHS